MPTKSEVFRVLQARPGGVRATAAMVQRVRAQIGNRNPEVRKYGSQWATGYRYVAPHVEMRLKNRFNWRNSR